MDNLKNIGDIHNRQTPIITEDRSLLTAEMASVLSNKKTITIEQVSDCIRSNATNGQKQTMFFDTYFPLELISKLLNLGYTVKKYEDANHTEVIKISW